MKITFYGVRGSIAAPGKHTAKYGGNTPCVFVKTDAGTHIILDAGTGVRKLGEDLSHQFSNAKASTPLHFLFSHYHWDHIQGFPFFKPIYHPLQKISITSAHIEQAEECPVLGQLSAPHFPVDKDQLRSHITHLDVDENGKLLINDATITTQPLNHPGGGTGYRIETPQGSMVYITDNELDPPTAPRTTIKEWQRFVANVDILIHDAMFLASEQKAHHGWGHSTITQSLELARDAKVKKLVLFHHETERSDQELDALLAQSRQWMKRQGSSCQVFMAKEGDQYTCSQYSIENHALTTSGE